MKYLEDFKKFVINYVPFEWERTDKSLYHNERFSHSLEKSFIRFYKVFYYLKKIQNTSKNKNKIVDVGSYPGNMFKLCQYLFGENFSKPFNRQFNFGLSLFKVLYEINIESFLYLNKCVNLSDFVLVIFLLFLL